MIDESEVPHAGQCWGMANDKPRRRIVPVQITVSPSHEAQQEITAASSASDYVRPQASDLKQQAATAEATLGPGRRIWVELAGLERDKPMVDWKEVGAPRMRGSCGMHVGGVAPHGWQCQEWRGGTPPTATNRGAAASLTLCSFSRPRNLLPRWRRRSSLAEKERQRRWSPQRRAHGRHEGGTHHLQRQESHTALMIPLPH